MASSKELAAEEAKRKTEALDWIEAVIEEKVPRDQPFEKVLKDGIILCKLINKIVPGSVKKVNKGGGNFALMENLAAYQKAIKAYGVPDEEIFQTVDLFEARNIKQVVKSIHALGRICQQKNFQGPVIGPKMAESQHREWTEDQLRANRQGIIGLQMGSNQGATQAGLNIGKARSIND